jgi:hypothetical protein
MCGKTNENAALTFAAGVKAQYGSREARESYPPCWRSEERLRKAASAETTLCQC